MACQAIQEYVNCTSMNTNGNVYSDRCKVCRTPIRGIRALPYRLKGIMPFAKNPQLCNRCSKVSFPQVEQEITVLFADIRGFTSLSEKMSPTAVHHLLNIFYTAASELLIKNDALVDKFMGDAVMALFNAPIPEMRHREVAVRTAIAFQEKMASLSLPFGAGIGLNSGLALTGNVGMGGVTDYTAIGDTVNIASRLSGLARKGEILAGLSTFKCVADLLPAKYNCKQVSLQVKGKEEVVEAYRIFLTQEGGGSASG